MGYENKLGPWGFGDDSIVGGTSLLLEVLNICFDASARQALIVSDGI